MYHTSERIIKNKVGLLNLAEELGNISKACKVMGFSRETFYRYQRAVDEGGRRRPAFPTFKCICKHFLQLTPYFLHLMHIFRGSLCLCFNYKALPTPLKRTVHRLTEFSFVVRFMLFFRYF